MDYHEQAVDETPIDLIATLSLAADKSFLIQQIVGTTVYWRLGDSSSTSPGRALGHVMGAYESITLPVKTGAKLWIWTLDSNAILAVSEIPA